MIENIKITKKLLDNGLEIVHAQLPFGNSQYIGFWVKAGASDERERKYWGISHFLEHMLFNGSKNFPEFTKTRLELAARGIAENAWTWLSNTHYYMIMPNRSFEFAFDVLLDRVVSPIMEEKLVEKEKGIIVEERKMADNDPENALEEALKKRVFKGSTYSHPTLGYMDTIRGMSKDLLEQYHGMFYSPNNMMFLSYGSMSYDEIEPVILQKLQSLKPAELWEHDVYNLEDDGGEEREDSGDSGDICLEKDVEAVFLNIISKIPNIVTPKQHTAYYMLGAILALGEASLLNQKLVLRQSLVSSFDFGIQPFRDLSMLSMHATMDDANFDEVKSVLTETLENVISGKFEDKEFERAKSYIEGKLLRTYESIWMGYEPNLANVFRLNFLADNSEKELTPTSVLESIRAVERDEIVELWQELVDTKELVSGSVVDKKKL